MNEMDSYGAKLMNIQEYVSRLKEHDWTYQFSDDGRMYNRGEAERNILQSMRKELDPDYEIWNQHCPEYFQVKR